MIIDTSAEAVERLCESLDLHGYKRVTAQVRALAAERDAANKRVAELEGALLAANKLWTMCVQDGWPWAEGSIQDSLTELGLLYEKDMTPEDSGPECTNCEGGCNTCYRAVTRIEDAAMEKANG